jgi:hypothetical protein
MVSPEEHAEAVLYLTPIMQKHCKEMDDAGENKQDVVLNTLLNNKYHYLKGY